MGFKKRIINKANKIYEQMEDNLSDKKIQNINKNSIKSRRNIKGLINLNINIKKKLKNSVTKNMLKLIFYQPNNLIMN